MRIFVIAAAAGILSAAALGTAFAVPSPTNVGPGGACIYSRDIDHTRAPDDKTILFYMRDGMVYRSNLPQACSQLSFNGFAYGPIPPDEICGNLQMIRVIRTGNVCMMGPLMPYTPPTKS
jgi:hypothetical protein